MDANLTSLLEGIARGNSEALLKFYDRTSARVFGVIGNLVPDRVRREALMERIYLEVWNTAGDFDPDVFSPGAWLITLAHQMAVTDARDDETVDARGSDGAPAMESLSAVQRKCVELTYYRGMTVSQASEHLGMTEQATSGALSEAVGSMTPAADELLPAG